MPAMSEMPTALIVDDEPHVRTYLKLVLKQIGIGAPLEAANGQEAVDIYKEKAPGIVLLDVNMPVKEGLEALKEIMEYDEDAIVVMTTSVASRQAVESSIEHGASHYIRKDTPKEEIAATLRELVEDVWEAD